MDTHHLETPRTARFHTLGDARSCSEVWYLLHGYGQGAADLMDACTALVDSERLIVAPEALSRFYLRGGTGPVGASWMTREDRELEIRDYVRWLDGVAAHVQSAASKCRATVLGFSQGAATAWRWALLGSARVERLIAWGGALPNDVDLGQHRGRLGALRIQVVRGATDPSYDATALERDRERLTGAGLAPETRGFQGGHRLDDELLRQLAGAAGSP
jgi:predicted esterase